MIFLPNCARGITTLCADEQARYALTGVECSHEKGGLFRLVATNGRYLGVLRGPCRPTERELEAAKSLPHLQSQATKSVLPRRDLAEMLGNLGKRKSPIPESLGVHLGTEHSWLWTPEHQRRVPTIDGRFPDYMAVIPKGIPLVSVRLNPHLLCELLKAAAQIPESDREDAWVEILFFGPDKPIGVRTNSKSGLAFDGLLMPLT